MISDGKHRDNAQHLIPHTPLMISVTRMGRSIVAAVLQAEFHARQLTDRCPLDRPHCRRTPERCSLVRVQVRECRNVRQ